MSTYPASTAARDQWIIAQRPDRNHLDPLRPYAFLVEDERSAENEIVPVATIFLTNRECPFRCVMCDLWKNTLTTTVPTGAIPAQIQYALSQLPPSRQIKLYNAGSFFDPQAIPPEDYAAIATQTVHFERVIVECHPSLANQRCLQFKSNLTGKLEVAMGLETAHPEVLTQLNKRMTLDQFKRAADFLQQNEIALRVFILVQPPFMREEESLEWAARSLDFAFNSGATAATLIPTRAGNGAMEHLQIIGQFSPPKLSTLEAAANYGLTLNRGRVFTDLWDAKPTCPHCGPQRIERLHQMNLHQTILAPIECSTCEGRT
ncbi:radical SAM protein [Edaphobacter acidisoli]|uniref:Radical SAM protein n=1 Tax=Edaphobacter acidisoli TaxID=2040573 RepID=A0A916RR58_9BACT|nr:radical SAM protein [Edaphobacter acidisoli]GGA63078.1 radical SAM protein [Edaphobacter acidisoli]